MPVQGLSEEKAEQFTIMGVTSVADLADLNYAKWAEAIVELAVFEE